MRFRDAILSFLFLPAFVFSYAQEKETQHKVGIEIPEVALLGLASENSPNVNISFTAPQQAGNPVDISGIQNENIWINYSSIVSGSEHRRKIVAMVEGEIPEGVQIKVEASEAAGSGKGKTGEPAGAVTLSAEPTEVIVNIGSCFTGKGSSNGHYLTYKVETDESFKNYPLSTLENASIHVVYTLTD